VSKRLFAIVVDDDPSVRKALRRLLRAAGMEVETRSSAASFLQTPLHREPDCLILDIRMPEMSGPELHQSLVAMGRHIPVVFITAHEADADLSEAGEAAILHKPFDDEALLDAILRAVEPGDA
jgi:FixJ family two-component response regulator